MLNNYILKYNHLKYMFNYNIVNIIINVIVINNILLYKNSILFTNYFIYY